MSEDPNKLPDWCVKGAKFRLYGKRLYHVHGVVDGIVILKEWWRSKLRWNFTAEDSIFFWCVRGDIKVERRGKATDVDAKALETVEAIFKDLRDRRFLKWIFDERGDECHIGDLNGHKLTGLDLEVQGQIKAAWQVIIANAIADAR